MLQVAKLTDEDAIAINNLRMLGGEPDTKKTSTSSFALKFDMHKVKSTKYYSIIEWKKKKTQQAIYIYIDWFKSRLHISVTIKSIKEFHNWCMDLTINLSQIAIPNK